MRKTSSYETVDEYLSRNGHIKICDFHKHPDETDYEFPIKPKGKKIEGQDSGCLMIPRYSGQ